MSKQAVTKEIRPAAKGRMATRVVATCSPLVCPECGICPVYYGDALGHQPVLH